MVYTDMDPNKMCALLVRLGLSVIAKAMGDRRGRLPRGAWLSLCRRSAYTP